MGKERRRSIAVRADVYFRAKAFYLARDERLTAVVARLVRDDLRLHGVSGTDPGMPKISGKSSRPRVGMKRQWSSMHGKLYRRARVHSETIGLTMTVYVEQLLVRDMHKIATAAKPPPPRKVWAPIDSPRTLPRRAARPPRTEDDERQCEDALEALGPSPGGVVLL